MEGIKETKELLVGINELSLVLIRELKDGLQVGKDAMAIMNELLSNDELKDKLAAAVKGLDALDEELKDISLEEGVELGMVQVSYIGRLVDAAKKKAE